MDLEIIAGARDLVQRSVRYTVADPWHDPVVLFGRQIEQRARRLIEGDRFEVSVGWREAGLRIAFNEPGRQALAAAIKPKLRIMPSEVREFYFDVLQIVDAEVLYGKPRPPHESWEKNGPKSVRKVPD